MSTPRSGRKSSFALGLAVCAVASALAWGGCASRRAAGPAAPTAAAPVAPEAQVAAVRSALERWRQAYEVKSIEVLSQLYAADAMVAQQGSEVRGTAQLAAALTERLGRAKEVRVRLKDVTVVPLGAEGAAVAAAMTREISDGVTTVTEEGLLSLALRQQGGAWVIVSEHYSYLTR